MTAPPPKATRARYRLTLRPKPDVADAERALNRWKVALRTFGFRCVSAEKVQP